MSGGFVISTFFLYKLLVYLCHKTKHHQSDSTPRDESNSRTVGRENTTKLEVSWRDRTESERKCAEYIALKRIEEKVQNIATSIQSNEAQNSASPTINSGN